MKSVIIYLTGPDGAGKTTLASMLIKLLRRYGVKARISYIRGTHTIASILARIMSKFGYFRGLDNPIYNIRIPRTIRKIWWVIEFFSAIPIFIVRFAVASLFYRVIVGDRSPLDTLIWILLTTNSLEFLRTFMGKILLLLTFKSHCIIYMYADLQTLIVRKHDMPKEFIAKQVKVYATFIKIISKYHKVLYVDTTKTKPDESILEILSSIWLDILITKR